MHGFGAISGLVWVRKPKQIDFNSINCSKISVLFLGYIEKNYTKIELAEKMKSHWLLD